MLLKFTVSWLLFQQYLTSNRVLKFWFWCIFSLFVFLSLSQYSICCFYSFYIGTGHLLFIFCFTGISFVSFILIPKIWGPHQCSSSTWKQILSSKSYTEVFRIRYPLGIFLSGFISVVSTQLVHYQSKAIFMLRFKGHPWCLYTRLRVFIMEALEHLRKCLGRRWSVEESQVLGITLLRAKDQLTVCVYHTILVLWQALEPALHLPKQAQIWCFTPHIQVNIFQALEQTAQDALESSSLEMLKNTHGCRAKGQDLLIYWLAMLG